MSKSSKSTKRIIKKECLSVNKFEHDTLEISRQLELIQEKLANSPALNGGFETLLFKVDKIEESQGQIHNRIDSIHDAIYDQERGVFTKISEINNKIIVQTAALEKEIYKIETEQNQEKQDLKNIEEESDKVASIQSTVKELENLKNLFFKISKWFAIAIGGGVITALIKFVYALFTNHVKFM